MSFERRKVRVGRVVSDKMNETVVVQVERRRTHPLYRKSIKRRTRFKAHDENNTCKVGDLIKIIETRPLSKTKRWRVVEILVREDIAEVQPEEIGIDETIAAGEGLDVAAEAAPAPKAGRRAKAKAPEPPTEEQIAAEAVQEEAEPEEPKPKARRRAKAKAPEPPAEEQVATEALQEEPEPEEPKPKARRRARAKAPEPPGEEPAAAESEEQAEATEASVEPEDPDSANEAQASSEEDSQADEEKDTRK